MNFRKDKRFITVTVLTLMFSIALCFCALGVDDGFESSIAAFPESYKPYLRALHEKYPEWVFQPFETGLDWKTVIDNEVGAKSLIEHSASSENLKSKEPGDYDAAKDKYIYKDGGFVTANRLAVEYFIDPRNFLTEEGIFQFELLSFSDSFTVADVEAVLKGSFMCDSFITYYDAEGALVKTEEKYAEAIFEAGKAYNINPCYIASKIRNEVGADGSASVSGTHSVYPGIYNFYNIGATDGTGAITRGLAWANGGSDGTATSYGRPWNTPAKSIMGGAEYLAKSYIAVGQFTGYLQKFNVNPNGDKALFTHQYMTNVSGACSQGYTNYTAYAKTGKLYQKNIFSIPIFENMPSENISGEKAFNADSAFQTAKISASSSCNVRTGPSTSNAKLTDSSGKTILLQSGTAVNVLSKTVTDSDYYINFLKYPHWVYISFTVDGKAYEGYVPEDFVSYTSQTKVDVGEYTLTYHKGDNTNPAIISSDSATAKVLSNSAVEFLKKGTVYLTVYDSVGRYDIVKYTVSETAPAAPEVKVTAYTETLKITVTSDETFEKYIYTVSDKYGNVIKSAESDKASLSIKGFSSGSKYTVSVKGVSGNSHSAAAGAIAVTKPYKVTDVTMTYTDTGAVLSWEKVESCEGYLTYGYDADNNKYVKLDKVSSEDSIYELSEEKLIYDSYCVRAYCKNGSKSVYGDYSDKVTPKSKLTPPKNFEVSSIRTNGYTLSWDSVPGAKSYNIYISEKGDWKKLISVTGNSYTVTALSPGTEKIYAVAAVSGNDTSLKSEELYAMTAPEKVSGFKASDITSSQMRLSWSKAEGAAYYNLYLYENGEYKLYDEYSVVSCSFASLSQFTEYKFKIAAVAKGEKNTLVGPMSDELIAVTLPQKVSGLRPAEIKDKSVKLTWQANDKALKYTVYLYDSDSDTYKNVCEASEPEALVTGLKMATEYKFVVTCEGEINGKSYVSDYSDPVRVTTDYAVPDKFKLSSIKSTSYKLSWEEIDEAVSYNIYRKKGNVYEELASVKTNSYTAGGLSYGETDGYKVSAVYKVGKKEIESELSAEVKCATLPSKVKNLTATVYTQTAKLKWDSVKNATHYEVFIYEDGEYVLMDTVSTAASKLTGLREGAKYKFAVRAITKLEAGTAKGSRAAVTKYMKPAKVTKVTLTSTTTSKQTISWSAAVGANYYYIYRYSSKSGSYVKVGETSSRSYSFSSLSAGKTYSYRVYSAVVKDGKELVKGDKSATYKFSTNPAKVSSLKSTSVTSSKVALSWGKVSAATCYEVLYYSKSLGTYVLAGTTEKNSFTVKSLSGKTDYKFKVRAIRTVNGSDYMGEYSSAISVKTK